MEFAKKTGDYRSLSAVDIRVMALSYQLEKEFVGTEHIKEEPDKKVPLTIIAFSKWSQVALMAILPFYL